MRGFPAARRAAPWPRTDEQLDQLLQPATAVSPLEYLVIGAGPAGLQLGYYLKKNGRNFLILERGDAPGTFFQTYPRHRVLISINKPNTGHADPELNLRWDWNSLLSDNPDLRLTRYSGAYFPHPDELRRYLAEFAVSCQLPVRYRTEVRRVSREGDLFVVTDAEGGRYQARCLVVATGPARECLPDIPGIDLCDTYGRHSIDASEYRNQRVLIIGKGNSAFETADHLTSSAAVIHVLSPHSLRLAWESHYVGHLRAVNNNFLDTYQLKSQNAVIDATIDRISRADGRYLVDIRYSHANGQAKRLTYDRVIACTGFQFDDAIFDDSCRPETVLNGRYPAQTTAWESTNVPGLFVAGHLMHACDYKRTMSGFIHGFRHNIATLSALLEERYHGREWPHEVLPATPEAVLGKVMARLNQSSALFLQPGFLADAVVIDEATETARYYPEVRRDHLEHTGVGRSSHHYTVTLEYGPHKGDPFAIERDPAPEAAHEAFYLHPVIRRYAAGSLVAEHHINDDLENEWVLPEYVDPAAAFFRAQFARDFARAQ